ncbi:SDR family oxidoreductase [Nocardia jejuensis]|uniref:SDR family oxidoreductase n=1 Tax=Nocardia jejuensis TaxID=328049 RepID=UPI00082E48B0|nr:SDR family NAD(P)-dependent oxidoreductase [Nocardia jejuensis]
MDIAGRVAVVTGGGSGIGAGLARALAGGGARVVVADLVVEAAEAVAEQIDSEYPGAALGLGVDVSDEAAVGGLVDRAEEHFGPVDMFFANAGVPGEAGLDAGAQAWASALGVNVMAHVHAAKAMVPRWIERGGGYFVSTASAAGLLTQLGSATYSVSKHAAVGFAEWLSITYGDKGIKVSCVCPMGVRTPLLDAISGSDTPDAVLAGKAVTTAGAVLDADEVAQTVLAGMAAGQFLILPHPQVLDMYRGKAADYDRWLAGMRRYQETLRTPAE